MYCLIEDPVQVLKLKKKPKNSVEKMLIDILSDPKTAKLFYVNDIEVLIDIIIRQLLNIPSDEMVIIYRNIKVTYFNNVLYYLDKYLNVF